MSELLKNIDNRLFLFINSHRCSFCDFIFYWASDKVIWVPFYFFLAFVFYRKLGTETWKLLLAVAVLIFLNDQLSVLIKDSVMRYRPCHNLILQSQIHMINNYCGGQFGFVSSHAANSFALASFLVLVFRRKIKWLPGLLAGWCFIIAYSRIYAGVHYPSDIIGGWILGFILASIIFYFFKNIFKKKHE